MRLKFDLAKLATRGRRGQKAGGGGVGASSAPGGSGSSADADKLTGMMGEGHAASTARRDPLKLWKILVGVLAVANVAAFFLLVKPVGGSASDLEARLADLQRQVQRQQISLRGAKSLVSKVDGARTEHDKFMQAYFLDRRTMSSTILGEIKDTANKAGLVPKEHSFGFDPIEGTENLGMMTITANYEGDYKQLVEFVHMIDQSKRFLIIDNIQAAPQQQSARLTVRFKINAFVREMPRPATLSATPAEPLATQAPEGDARTAPTPPVRVAPAAAPAPAKPLAVAPPPAAAPAVASPVRPSVVAVPVSAKPSATGERK